MPTRDDALALARNGWAVLPLRGKIPTTAHGVKDATTDPAQIAAWWPGNARHNVGARVPSTLVVIDIDPQNGGSIQAIEEAAGVALPETLTVHSGRGTGGRHLYYLHPGGQLTSTRLPAGIDVKTSRGYCVMPPSLHPATGAPYLWEGRHPVALPASLAVLIRPAERQRTTPAPAKRPATMARRALYLAQHVQNAQDGNRNACLFWAACQAIRDGHPDDTFDLLEGAAVAAGLSDAEAQRTIASARRQNGRT
ncbi:bifunctional DNA primase/polymerase [Microbacterium sp. RU33B]|uniref:bifunctional DNA primase/polymerase n=1 Tax=Microbacterium sp. RU33B TaxID=1907390 RepID=UPI00095CCB22|nr:bifunctional DNA primase/polymerase [Microbacterium sp. RU33B]SIT73624.1 Bifunctional DNA primase/polymerase, N-terminal [Microbacterium sp. RU33B]